MNAFCLLQPVTNQYRQQVVLKQSSTWKANSSMAWRGKVRKGMGMGMGPHTLHSPKDSMSSYQETVLDLVKPPLLTHRHQTAWLSTDTTQPISSCGA
jgi:hypothetical protein